MLSWKKMGTWGMGGQMFSSQSRFMNHTGLRMAFADNGFKPNAEKEVAAITTGSR
jgi:hypothetical protein